MLPSKRLAGRDDSIKGGWVGLISTRLSYGVLRRYRKLDMKDLGSKE